MRIGELERRSGLGRDTLRFYERSGLITPPRRQANGYRDYDDHTLAELHFIRTARELGFALDEIRVAMPSLRAPPARCDTLLAKLRERRETLEADVAHRQGLLRRLDALMARFGGTDS
ncbi:MAG: MerR family transcriptional regulator [Lysobacteraceae bacterium]